MSDQQETIDYAKVFVCEIKDDIVIVYEWRKQLIELSKNDFVDKNDIELGQMFELVEGRYELIGEVCGADTELETFAKEGVVHAKVLAFAPNEAFLSEFDNLKKYRNTAYSHLLQLLNDPNDLFFDFPQSEVGLATVKYAPNSKTIFEVVEVEEVPEKYKRVFPSLDYFTSLAPWFIEHRLMIQNQTSVPQEAFPRFHQDSRISPAAEFIGVCVEIREISERSADRNKQWQNIYSPVLGMVHATGNVAVELGDWVRFTMNDKVEKSTSGTGNRNRNQDQQTGRAQGPSDNPMEKKKHDHYGRASVTGIAHIAAQLPTRVAKASYKKVEQMSPYFTTSILFDHDMLETKENAAITDWEKRKKGLSETAHFYCPSLGKVEIYPTSSEIILKSIEAHREKLKTEDPTLYETLKDEQITIEVEVVPYRSIVARFRKDLSCALFLVKNVGRITYLIGGRLIERKNIEN